MQSCSVTNKMCSVDAKKASFSLGKAVRNFVLVLALLAVLGISVQGVQAAPNSWNAPVVGITSGTANIIATVRPLRVLINGEPVIFPDRQPVIINGRTLVPVRFVAETFGAIVSWDGVSVVTLIHHDVEIKLTIGSNMVYRAGVSSQIDVPAQIIGGRTFVPLRFISEILGATVVWDGENNQVLITPMVVAAAPVIPSVPIPVHTGPVPKSAALLEHIRTQRVPVVFVNGVQLQFVEKPAINTWSSSAIPLAEFLKVFDVTPVLNDIHAVFQFRGRDIEIELLRFASTKVDGVTVIHDIFGHGYACAFVIQAALFPAPVGQISSWYEWTRRGTIIWQQDLWIIIEDFLYTDRVAMYNLLHTVYGTVPLSEYGLFSNLTVEQFAVIKATAEEVTRGITCDFEKFRALSTWVSNHVFYDWDAYRHFLATGELAWEISYDVLRSRTAVCSGYSDLLQALTYAIGIPSRIVASKTHGWVEAHVNGRWVVSDATWNSRQSFSNGAFGPTIGARVSFFDMGFDFGPTLRHIPYVIFIGEFRRRQPN